MKALYFDCGMGAAGDMLSSALIELFDNKDEVLSELNSLGLPHTEYRAEGVKKCGIEGTKIRVLVMGTEEGKDHTESGHAHSHNGFDGVKQIIYGTNAAPGVKEKAISVYRLLAEAESRVHNTEIENVHFHEVGTLDAVADILAFCYMFNKLEIDYVTASPVNVGSGSVKCAHGILPVPAPAAAELLKGVPIYSDNTKGELCTPTGAALLRAFVNEFSDMPIMRAQKIGYGMGTKDFEKANCVRAFLGTDDSTELIFELSFNVDDMTAEEIAFGTEELLRCGAKDVFVSPVTMKKSRQGTLVTVLFAKDKREEIIRLIFKHFSTLGIRETLCRRYFMKRSVTTVETKYGAVRRKDSEGYGQVKSKYEYDDLARIARENDLSIGEIKKSLENGEAL